jgi:MATE family multidrug resistance protein
MGKIQNIAREAPRTFALALPIIAGFLGQMLMGVADAVMVGWVGVTQLAACAFANNVLSVPMVFGFGILSAVSVSASHSHGSNRPRLAGESLRGGLLIALTMGLILVTLVHVLIPFISVFGQAPEVNETAKTYFLYIAWSLVPLFVTGSTKNFCEALERPWPPFWIMIGGVLLNVLLNWVFIFGNLGMPALGIDGAGLATLLSRSATMLGVICYPFLSPILREALPNRWLAGGLFSECRRLLGIGLHSGGLSLCEVSGFAFGAVMMGWLGVIPLAAHQIAISCAGATFMVPLGLGQALSVRVSHARGGQRDEQISAIVNGALLLTVGMMAVFASCYLFLGKQIASVFVDDAAVTAVAIELLVLAGVFQVFDGIQIVSSGALRGFGDTKIPFLIGIVSYWFVALPTSWLAAFHLHLGARGIWVGFVFGLAVAAIALFLRLQNKVRQCSLITDK